MQDFKCITGEIATLKTKFEEMQKLLQDSASKAEEVKAGISDNNNWEGSAQLVGVAFMDLITQYHTKLADSEAGPIVQAEKAFDEYLNNNGVFYGEWKEYQQLLMIPFM